MRDAEMTIDLIDQTASKSLLHNTRSAIQDEQIRPMFRGPGGKQDFAHHLFMSLVTSASLVVTSALLVVTN